MFEQAVDYHLQATLRQVLDKNLDYATKKIFSSQFSCQLRNFSVSSVEDAVFLVKSDKNKGRFVGLNHCNNPWICPVCTARVMSKRRTQIQIAIETLIEKNYKGMMFTFTIPHNQWYSCEDTFEILKNSMRKFQKHSGNQINAKKFCSNAWTRMYRDLNFCHYVRMAEVTFGKNGWHPHYHAIYWTKKPLNDALKFESEINQFWLKIVKQETKKQFYKTKSFKYSKQEIDGRVDEIFDRLSEDTSFYISKDKSGEIVQAMTSDYIAAWGTDSELTKQECKQAAEGHYNQFDLLAIIAGHKRDDKMPVDKATKNFLDFAIYIKKQNFYRAKFSLSKDEYGKTIYNYIAEYKQTQAYKEYIKKNYIEKWEVVCWFTKKQWFKISELERAGVPMRSNILYLVYDTKLLQEYLESFDIRAFDNYEHGHFLAIENLMNNAA